ncbi:MAG: hypothetical protein JNM14_01600 [Ferruginibacter sp.]|nr:hypothetical protein [Ferruginibacter sp.]
MKKIFLLLAMAAGLSSITLTGEAQLLKKLKNAAGGGGSSQGATGKVSEKEEKNIEEEAAKDMANPLLDGQPFDKQDDQKACGIYYATSPVIAVNGSKTKQFGVQKFLINRVKNENIVYEISTAYAFDADDKNKVEPYKVNRETKYFKWDKKCGMGSLRYISDCSLFYIDGDFTSKINNEGKDVFPTSETKVMRNLNEVNLHLLEPGIIIGYKNIYEECCIDPKGSDYDAAKAKAYETFHKPIIFYTKEKEAKAKALTLQQVQTIFKTWYQKLQGMYNAGAGGEELPAPGAAASSSLFSAAKAQVLTAMKAYLAKEGMSQYVPEYAYIYNNYSEFGPITMPHPQTGVTVTSGRTVTFYVVCKNLKTNAADGRKFFDTDYVYFWVNLGEDVKPGQYNSQNFTGKWYIFNSQAPIGLDKEEAMKYKGK